MEETDSLVQIMTTVDSLKKAEELARMLVEERYAACSQVLGPIKSTTGGRDVWRELRSGL